ncbi:hypothetical protein [Kribbella deserti]|uniref:Uncharacterized protein n=1 Tax=Kribbella deserti TaxID=1926257 RepID=A0ABV6QCY0_9ACTN
MLNLEDQDECGENAVNIREDLDHATRAVRDLEAAVGRLQHRIGHHLDVQRLADDVQRCQADLLRLTTQTRQPASHPDLVLVPDDDYDATMWQDADHEGVRP